MNSIFLFIFVNIAICKISKTKDVRGGTSLKVIYPPCLADLLDEIPVSLGNFGHIQYGTVLKATLVTPEENTNGCSSFSKFFPPNSMVLVDSGGCPITTKVRNIEIAGGQLALIGDAI